MTLAPNSDAPRGDILHQEGDAAGELVGVRRAGAALDRDLLLADGEAVDQVVARRVAFAAAAQREEERVAVDLLLAVDRRVDRDGREVGLRADVGRGRTNRADAQRGSARACAKRQLRGAMPRRAG